MNVTQWEKIERIYNSTLALPAAEREAFLKHECGGDLELRHEIESLLNETGRPDKFFSEPAFSLGLEAFATQDSPNLERHCLKK